MIPSGFDDRKADSDKISRRAVMSSALAAAGGAAHGAWQSQVGQIDVKSVTNCGMEVAKLTKDWNRPSSFGPLNLTAPSSIIR